MYVIRQSVFETNSSSQHVLVCLKHNNILTHTHTLGINIDNLGSFCLDEKDLTFKGQHRQITIIDNPEDKLCYAIASLCQDKCILDCLKILEQYIIPIVKKYEPNFKKIVFSDNNQWCEYFTEDGENFSVSSNKDIITKLNLPEKDLRLSENVRLATAIPYTCKNIDTGEEITIYAILVPYVGYVDNSVETSFTELLNKYGVSLEEFITDSQYEIIYCDNNIDINISIAHKQDQNDKEFLKFDGSISYPLIDN